jgi:hypothetical protein
MQYLYGAKNGCGPHRSGNGKSVAFLPVFISVVKHRGESLVAEMF